MTTSAEIWARMAELAEQATHSWGQRQPDGSIRERSELDGARFAALLREEAAKARPAGRSSDPGDQLLVAEMQVAADAVAATGAVSREDAWALLRQGARMALRRAAWKVERALDNHDEDAVPVACGAIGDLAEEIR